MAATSPARSARGEHGTHRTLPAGAHSATPSGGRVVEELAWCANAWCGDVFDAAEGWAGRCPSCLALADEHLAGTHTGGLVEPCTECRREALDTRRARRSA